MRVFQRLIVVLMLFVLTGCFQLTTVVHVNPDGSGTVEETMLLSKKVLAQFDEAMRNLTGGAGSRPPFDIFQPDALQKQARNMGKGVQYHSGRRVETPEYKGYLAVYKFKDINTLILPHRNGSAVGATGAGSGSGTPFATFRFKKGPTSTLIIVLPKSQRSEIAQAASGAKESEEVTLVAANPPEIFVPPAQSEADAGDSPEIYAPPGQTDQKTKELVEMMMGMKFSLVVEVNGAILTTDATHREGNRLTVFNMDMTELANVPPAELERLRQMPHDSIEELRELAKSIPGIKFELKDEMTVVFTRNRK